MKTEKHTVVYRQTWEYAEENGQEDLYRTSLKANIACKNAIEAAISRYYHVDGYTLDTKNCAKELINVFGLERVAYVLANTLLYKRYDGRISPENLHWARTLSVVYEPLAAGHGTVNTRYVVGSCNTGLTDLLATRIRKLHMVHNSIKQNNEMEKTI